MMPTSERRAQPRATLTSPVVVSVAGERVHCAAVDISTLGMALCGPLQPGEGECLRIEFKVGSRWHDASAVVVRETPLGGARIWGLQFVVVEDRTLTDIHAHVVRSGATATPAVGGDAPRSTASYGTPVGETATHGTAEFDAGSVTPVRGLSGRPIPKPRRMA